MNDMYYEKPKPRLPRWFWVLTVAALVITVLAAYFSASNLTDYLSELGIEDTNGESTDLCKLDFKNFLGVYDGEYEYNYFDSEISCLIYDTTRDYDYSLETYSNVFYGAYTEQEASFWYLNYYDVCFVHELSSPKTVTVDFSYELSKGNLEGRLLYVSSDFKVELNENDVPIIKDEYISVLAEFKAGTSRTASASVQGSGMLVFVVGGESAVGSYSLSIH